MRRAAARRRAARAGQSARRASAHSRRTGSASARARTWRRSTHSSVAWAPTRRPADQRRAYRLPERRLHPVGSLERRAGPERVAQPGCHIGRRTGGPASRRLGMRRARRSHRPPAAAGADLVERGPGRFALDGSSLHGHSADSGMRKGESPPRATVTMRSPPAARTATDRASTAVINRPSWVTALTPRLGYALCAVRPRNRTRITANPRSDRASARSVGSPMRQTSGRRPSVGSAAMTASCPGWRPPRRRPAPARRGAGAGWPRAPRPPRPVPPRPLHVRRAPSAETFAVPDRRERRRHTRHTDGVEVSVQDHRRIPTGSRSYGHETGPPGSHRLEDVRGEARPAQASA